MTFHFLTGSLTLHYKHCALITEVKKTCLIFLMGLFLASFSSTSHLWIAQTGCSNMVLVLQGSILEDTWAKTWSFMKKNEPVRIGARFDQLWSNREKCPAAFDRKIFLQVEDLRSVNSRFDQILFESVDRFFGDVFMSHRPLGHHNERHWWKVDLGCRRRYGDK